MVRRRFNSSTRPAINFYAVARMGLEKLRAPGEKPGRIAGKKRRRKRRPARLIFHKFEKHTRGSRCVNLNFSATAAEWGKTGGGNGRSSSTLGW